MKSTLFFPLVPFALKLAVIAGWFAAVFIIASGSHPQYQTVNGTSCIPKFLDVSSPDWHSAILAKQSFRQTTIHRKLPVQECH